MSTIIKTSTKANTCVEDTYVNQPPRMQAQEGAHTISSLAKSQLAWNFHIGGYRPAHKWIKDRKGTTLTTDEIVHYTKIITALEETHRIMNEIDNIEFGFC